MDLAGAQLTQRELARLAVSNISHATVVPALVKTIISGNVSDVAAADLLHCQMAESTVRSVLL